MQEPYLGEHLLRRDVKGQRSQVHLGVVLNAGEDEEDARALGAAVQKTTLLKRWVLFINNKLIVLYLEELTSRKMTARSYSCTTLMQKKSDMGKVQAAMPMESSVRMAPQTPC